MTDYQQKRIEAAARAMLFNGGPSDEWITMSDGARAYWLKQAEYALAAADAVPTPRDLIEAQYKAEQTK